MCEPNRGGPSHEGAPVVLNVCIETSTTAVSVAVGNELGVLASLEVHEGRRHAETLVPAIDVLLRFLQRDRRELTHVAVDVGPGLFTGLRVGVATAKGLALALSIPVAPFGSLELLALAADVPGPVLTALDARRSELYAAVFTGSEVLVEPFGAKASEVVEQVVRLLGPTVRPTVVGNGTGLDPEWSRLLRVGAPDAVTMARRIAVEFDDGSLAARLQRGDDVELRYLRASDAELALQ